MIDKFKRDIERGEVGEEKIFTLLKNNKDTKIALDIRDDSFFQKVDIDFLQVTEKDKVRKIEVKTDSIAHNTGNIVYEYYSDVYSGTQGCFEKTESDFIFYYLVETGELYIIHTEKLKRYVRRNMSTLKEANMGDRAWGFLIKLDTLVEESIAINKGII